MRKKSPRSSNPGFSKTDAAQLGLRVSCSFELDVRILSDAISIQAQDDRRELQWLENWILTRLRDGQIRKGWAGLLIDDPVAFMEECNQDLVKKAFRRLTKPTATSSSVSLGTRTTAIWRSTEAELSATVNGWIKHGKIVSPVSEKIKEKFAEVFDGLDPANAEADPFGNLRALNHAYRAELAKHVGNTLSNYLAAQTPGNYEEKKALTVLVNTILRDFGLAILYDQKPCLIRANLIGEEAFFRLEHQDASRSRPFSSTNLADFLPLVLTEESPRKVSGQGQGRPSIV